MTPRSTFWRGAGRGLGVACLLGSPLLAGLALATAILRANLSAESCWLAAMYGLFALLAGLVLGHLWALNTRLDALDDLHAQLAQEKEATQAARWEREQVLAEYRRAVTQLAAHTAEAATRRHPLP